jgi:hypothetical protein
MLDSRDVTKENLENDFFKLGLSRLQAAKKYDTTLFRIQSKMDAFDIKLNPLIKDISSQYVRLLYINNVQLTDKQESLLVGSILGDGSFVKTIERTAAFSIWQRADRKSYLEWIKEELQPFTPNSVKECTIKPKPDKEGNTRKSSKAVYLQTTHYIAFDKFLEMFYINKVKVVPEETIKYLNDYSLARWFEQDGCNAGSYSTFSTQAFTATECLFLLDVLLQKFKLTGRLGNSSGNVLIFSKEAHFKLHEIIDPLLHTCFDYKKLPEGAVYKGHPKGEDVKTSKLTTQDVIEIRELSKSGLTYKEISEIKGVGQGSIFNAVKGHGWKHIPVDESVHQKKPSKQPANKRILRGEDAPGARFTNEDIINIRKLAADGMTRTAIGEIYGVRSCTISMIVNRKVWKHI